MADRKISDLTALTTPASGDYLPIVDISETAASSKNKRITIEELFRGVPLGTAAAPSIAIEGDENTGIHSPGADELAISTNGTERARITSDGKLGLGISSPQGRLHVGTLGIITAPTYDVSGAFAGIVLNAWNKDVGSNFEAVGDIIAWSDKQAGARPSQLRFFTAPNSTNAIPTQRMVIDSSGRLLVGTSSARNNVVGIAPGIQLEGANNNTPRSFGQIYGKSDAAGPLFLFAKHRSDSIGGQTVVSSSDELGQIVFTGSDGTNFVQGASIKGEVDGTPGANDMPGRLVFFTTADGAASPTERMRIKSSGIVNIANTPTYADNTAALAGGLVAGDIYRKSDGTLMITY